MAPPAKPRPKLTVPVQDRSGSPVAVLGYTAAVPIGQILLTSWGTVIVPLVAR